MMGLEISNNLKTMGVPVSLFCAVLTVFLGFWIGPMGIYGVSGLGFLFALFALIQRMRTPSFTLGRGVPTILLCFHVLFLIVGVILDILFLHPLASSSLEMPRLSDRYRAPDSFFEVRTPAGWKTEGIHAAMEVGVRLRPNNRQQYMGISELIVRVRELETPALNRAGFLKRMAETFSINQKKGAAKLFEFSTEPAGLLNGKEGLWSRLVVKRFWVPLYQLSLFGIKDQRYLCSVSATGLKSHATLFEVMCLGLYETIRVKPTEK